MINLNKVPARQPLSLTPQTADALKTAGSLIVDDRRRRSFFFDGRFLTARDLTREQVYFLTRQQDLGHAGGVGVVNGLAVTPGSTPTTIGVAAGHGVTPSGELVVVPADLTVDVARIADIEMLDAAFGLSPIPRAPARARTGLFVLVLRPVEFTANPIASYPTSLGGQRTVEDGDIIEAVALTLVPFPDQTSRTELDERRARAAREIFLSGGVRGVPVDALPIAMIALDHGIVRWVDMFLVRREVGAEPLDIVGVRQAKRALHEAHLIQYQDHLAAILGAPGAERRFSASQHFFALPPVGTLPAAAIDPDAMTQIFFPPEVDVCLAAIPEDELVPLVEESLSLPPIDLTLSGDDLAWTSVLILIPLPRDLLRRTAGTPPAGSGTPLPAPLPPQPPIGDVLPLPAIPILGPVRNVGGIISRPIGVVLKPSGAGATPVPVGSSLSDPSWRDLLRRVDPLWYVRRRNLPYKADVVGQTVDVPVINVNRDNLVAPRVTAVGLDTEYAQIKAVAGDPVDEALLMLSNLPSDHVLLFAGAVHALRVAMGAGPLTHANVVDVAWRFTDPDRGGGLARLEDAFPVFKAAPWPAQFAAAGTYNVVKSGSVIDLDIIAGGRDAAGITALGNALKALTQPPKAADIANLVKGLTS